MSELPRADGADTPAFSLLAPRLCAALPPFDPGSVWLAGAGPGDPGLLTLLTVKGLETADVILHDALLGDDILSLARPDAVRENVGKRAGKPSPKQDDINARLIHWAKQGRRVLRLKGGDPFVFGRGGEECLALAQAGTPFRVIPGVSSGIGGLAYAGVPVTHRGLSTAVTFITGHDRSGALPADMNWAALAGVPGALVFFMGLGVLDDIARHLMAAGKPPMTPTAIVSSASTSRQSVLETTLARAAKDAARLQARRPAIIAVGDVVRLRGAFGDWLLNRAVESPAHPLTIAV